MRWVVSDRLRTNRVERVQKKISNENVDMKIYVSQSTSFSVQTNKKVCAFRFSCCRPKMFAFTKVLILNSFKIKIKRKVYSKLVHPIIPSSPPSPILQIQHQKYPAQSYFFIFGAMFSEKILSDFSIPLSYSLPHIQRLYKYIFPLEQSKRKRKKWVWGKYFLVLFDILVCTREPPSLYRYINTLTNKYSYNLKWINEDVSFFCLRIPFFSFRFFSLNCLNSKTSNRPFTIPKSIHIIQRSLT